MMYLMHRTQIMLEEWQYQLLKAQAQQQECSLGELIRTVLARHLNGRSGLARKKLALLEGIAAEPTASGRDHDRVVYDEDQSR